LNRRPLAPEASALTKLRHDPQSRAVGWVRTTGLRLIRAALRPAELRRPKHLPYGVLRTRSAIRTRTGAVLSGVPLPLGYPGVVMRALGAIRTRTVDVLNVVPLPLGYEGGMCCGRRTRTSNLPVQSRACCQIAPARIAAGEVMCSRRPVRRRDSRGHCRASEGVRSPVRRRRPRHRRPPCQVNV
jgi:hypothetical protein